MSKGAKKKAPVEAKAATKVAGSRSLLVLELIFIFLLAITVIVVHHEAKSPSLPPQNSHTKAKLPPTISTVSNSTSAKTTKKTAISEPKAPVVAGG